MHMCVNNLPRVALCSAVAEIRTRELLIARTPLSTLIPVMSLSSQLLLLVLTTKPKQLRDKTRDKQKITKHSQSCPAEKHKTCSKEN